jgi:zinc protease
LIVFTNILGQSQLSSRLGQELREKNALVYGFGSDLQLDSDTNVGALPLKLTIPQGVVSKFLKRCIMS